ncbi:MAG: hypothetical protein EAZ89_13335 [Bacteroidetes bacterium]|nr:MAG: hypothetical protein EAZ89_13335 [Bacteroidota bacterium]
MKISEFILNLFKPKTTQPWEPYGEEKRKIGRWIKRGLFTVLGAGAFLVYAWLRPTFPLLDDLWKMVVLGGTGIVLYLIYEFRHRLSRLAESWAEKLLPLLGYDTSSVEMLRLTLNRAQQDVNTLTETVDKLYSAEQKLHNAVEQLLRSKAKGTDVKSERILVISHRYKEVKKMRENMQKQRDSLAANVRALQAQREADKTALEATREAEEALAGLQLGNTEFTSYRMKDAENNLYYELTKSMASVQETMSDMRDPLAEEGGPSENDLEELVMVLKSEFGFNPADLATDNERYGHRPRNKE